MFGFRIFGFEVGLKSAVRTHDPPRRLAPLNETHVWVPPALAVAHELFESHGYIPNLGMQFQTDADLGDQMKPKRVHGLYSRINFHGYGVLNPKP